MQYHTALDKVQCQPKLYAPCGDLILESQHILLQVYFLALFSINLVILVLCSDPWFKAVLYHSGFGTCSSFLCEPFFVKN